MTRVAFKMKLNKGFEEEYKKRHDVLWPDLEQLLRSTGISEYSIFLDTETIIIDYKTGKENTKKYVNQLLKYQNALQGMGYRNIKMLLVYIDTLNVVEVS